MNHSIKSIAVSMTTLSPLMEGRDKISTNDIKKYHPNGISINAIDRIDDYFVFTFVEDEKAFAYTGAVMNKIFEKVVKEFDGDLGAVNEELAKEPLRVILEDKVSAKDNKITYTTVKVI